MTKHEGIEKALRELDENKVETLIEIRSIISKFNKAIEKGATTKSSVPIQYHLEFLLDVRFLVETSVEEDGTYIEKYAIRVDRFKYLNDRIREYFPEREDLYYKTKSTFKTPITRTKLDKFLKLYERAEKVARIVSKDIDMPKKARKVVRD